MNRNRFAAMGTTLAIVASGYSAGPSSPESLVVAQSQNSEDASSITAESVEFNEKDRGAKKRLAKTSQHVGGIAVMPGQSNVDIENALVAKPPISRVAQRATR